MAILAAIKKILNNRGLAASLLAGMLLVSALVALVPTYAGISLNRTFLKELENYQNETGLYPGIALVTAFYNENEVLGTLKELELAGQPALKNAKVLALLEQRRASIQGVGIVLDRLGSELGLQELMRLDNLASIAMQMVVMDSKTTPKTGRLQTLGGMDTNITLLRGNYPQAPQDGVFEVLATEEALLFMDAQVGSVVSCYPRLDRSHTPILVRISGTFDLNPEQALAWNFFKPVMFRESLMMRPEDTQEVLMGTPLLAASLRSFFAFEHVELLSAGLQNLSAREKNLNRKLFPYGGSFDMPVLSLASTFAQQEKALKTTLWMLNIPVLLMLLMYMAMVSGMVVESDAGEIAVQVSRGAGKKFLLINYLILGLLLSSVAMLLGPPLSVGMSTLLGSVNGFLSFVARSVPRARTSLEGYFYCATALLLSLLTLLIPAVRRQSRSILQLQRNLVRDAKAPWWSRLGLDILLFLVSLLAWYLLKTRPEWLSSATGEINPLIFMMMPFFVVCSTMVFLRLHPLLVRLIFRIGRSLWGAGVYLTLLRVSRNNRNYHYIMILLSLTIAIGVFSASAARTLNDNESDRLAYQIGADVRLAVNWPRQGSPGVAIPAQQQGMEKAAVAPVRYRFQEPSFLPFRNLAGVQHATRVFNRSAIQVSSARTIGNVQLMGIDPADFGRVAWYRDDLWVAHFYDYLNAISMDERNILISTSLSQRLDLRMDDWVSLRWEGSDTATFRVAGIIRHWPGWDASATYMEGKMLVVADLNAIQSLLAVEPYEVWLKLLPAADSRALYADMADKNIRPVFLRDFRQENTALINGATRIAVNGAMSLGFIASAIVCMLGFILYWQMYLRMNQLQLGLQRAMGFSVRQLFGMLLLEQLLTSVAAFVWGLLIGSLGSRMFVPMFEHAAAQAQSLPFRVRLLSSDRWLILAIIGFILVVCWVYLGYKIKRMRIAQAIKLGED